LELSGKAEATQGGTLGSMASFTEFQCILKETAMKNAHFLRNGPAGCNPTACAIVGQPKKGTNSGSYHPDGVASPMQKSIRVLLIHRVHVSGFG